MSTKIDDLNLIFGYFYCLIYCMFSFFFFININGIFVILFFYDTHTSLIDLFDKFIISSIDFKIFYKDKRKIHKFFFIIQNLIL